MKLKDCIMGIPVKYSNKWGDPENQSMYEKKQVGHIVGFTWNYSPQTMTNSPDWSYVEPIVLVKWCGEEFPRAIHPGNIERL